MACLVVVAAILMASGVAWAATLTGDGNDNTIDGTDSADTIDGKAGADTIRGKGGGDTIYGGEGRDKLYAVDDSENPADDGGGNYISGNENNDTIVGSPGADELYGARDNDTIDGKGGADTIDGGVGADVIHAGPLEEKDVDTVRGYDGNDTIYVANYPASKDIVGCGQGDNDKVVADSLDDVASSCEKVERIQEEEPNLEDGTYQLQPDSSSECTLGSGSFTISTDPSSGERGVEADLGGVEGNGGTAPTSESTPLGCEIKIDYETPVTAQGEVSAQATNTREYKGEKLTQAEVDKVIEESQGTTEETTDSATSSEDTVSAQYAWDKNKYNVNTEVHDPFHLKVNKTYHALTWWHNGYDVYKYSFNRYCEGGLSKAATYWYRNYCYDPYGMWYGSNSTSGWVGHELQAKYTNYDFGFDSLSTRAYVTNRIWGYQNGYGDFRTSFSAYGEAYWLLHSTSTFWYSF